MHSTNTYVWELENAVSDIRHHDRNKYTRSLIRINEVGKSTVEITWGCAGVRWAMDEDHIGVKTLPRKIVRKFL